MSQIKGLNLMSKVNNGTVKFFDSKKGWGFINTPDSPVDIFVHYTKIKTADEKGHRALKEGQKVAFETGTGTNGGPAAINVEILATSPAPTAPVKENVSI
jgi:CspA family cold shock protein